MQRRQPAVAQLARGPPPQESWVAPREPEAALRPERRAQAQASEQRGSRRPVLGPRDAALPPERIGQPVVRPVRRDPRPTATRHLPHRRRHHLARAAVQRAHAHQRRVRVERERAASPEPGAAERHSRPQRGAERQNLRRRLAAARRERQQRAAERRERPQRAAERHNRLQRAAERRSRLQRAAERRNLRRLAAQVQHPRAHGRTSNTSRRCP